MPSPTISFTVNGTPVTVDGASGSLLDALRDHGGIRSSKDGCSPQGQCGCCTVWVDGQPRVGCVTPVARVAGREITTMEGLADADEWTQRFADAGASQCGFCTPGIIMRVAALSPSQRTDAGVRQALLAHLCRCTGWNSVVDAVLAPAGQVVSVRRNADAAERRATLEGHARQTIGPAIAEGNGGFGADTAPHDALVAIRDDAGDWHVGPTMAAARVAAGRTSGRRTTAPLLWPIDLSDGAWTRTLQTTWVEPAYLELDAAWCPPGGEPSEVVANGGAFGGKVDSDVGDAARRLATEHDAPVLAVSLREDVVRRGPKRPPMAIAVRADGTGVVTVARTAGIADVIATTVPAGWDVNEVDVVGPRTSDALRGAGWAEVAAVLSSLRDGPWDRVETPDGGVAEAMIDTDGDVHVTVSCGDVLDEVTLRSYCVGAAHMALGWVRNEGIAVDADGVPLDLTIRSFGVLRAVDTPPIHVTVHDDSGPPVNGSDAVFAAVAAAAWRHAGFPPRWPTMRT